MREETSQHSVLTIAIVSIIITVVKLLVSVPDPKPTPTWIAFSIACIILEAIYMLDRSGDETMKL